MIPQRIKLKGFLCYKEEQAIDFDGNATLWMLSGLNGSGKSSIFDAVTYALFDHHRGGGRFAVELINKDSDSLLVEFDFLLEGKVHRAKRTLKRDARGGARGTQQIYRREGEEFEPVPDTGQKGMFDAWVRDHVGLSYETFTSSVLLLQGKAEKLLDSKPEGRREVLAGIVDLDRYRKLFEKADEQRKIHEASLKSLNNRLASIPVVHPLELQEAKNGIEGADAARQAARAESDRLHALDYQARLWQDHEQRLVAKRNTWQKARSLLGESASIEEAFQRLRELREVLPRLRDIAVRRSEMHQAEEQIKQLSREKQKLAEQLAQKEADLRKAHLSRQTVQATIEREDKSYRELGVRLRETTKLLETLKIVERQEDDLERLREDLGKLPADPMTLVAMQKEACARLEEVERMVPILNRFRQKREQLAEAFVSEWSFDERMLAIRQRGESLKGELERLTQAQAEAGAAYQQAAEQAASARTLLEQARASLGDLTQLDGSKLCRHCGQELTAGHLAEEKRRREAGVKQAEVKAKEAATRQEVARKADEKARLDKGKADEAYQTARNEYAEAKSQHKQAGVDIDRLQQECAHAYADVPEGFRKRIAPAAVADWRTTVYPAQADMDELKTRLRELDPARKKLRETELAAQRWTKLKAQESSVLDSLHRLTTDLPRDREGLRREHADRESQEKALFASLDSARAQVKRLEADVTKFTQERDAVRASQGVIDTRIKEQDLTRNNAERVIESQTRTLPPTWVAQALTVGMREMHTLQGELKHLEDQGTEDRARDLEHAQRNLAAIEQEVKDLEKQSNTFPADARQDPTVIGLALAQTRTRVNETDELVARARETLKVLQTRDVERQQADADCRKLEEELLIHRTLCDLLGKDRLQLHLVRQAEKQVVEYANAVLDRLSGGQLYLRLSGEAGGDGATAKALDLEAFNRATGEKPINVAFLSGSQKFRVAVSLALGIGQYASRRHRPIESVIIDEGFGCLDSQGRQVMIQELQNLRSQMRCILLVSHQEDFAESFSDGYQFRLENGATRVERVRK